MNKLIVVSLIAVQSLSLLAAPTADPVVAAKRSSGPGMVIKPGSLRGKVVFVDSQSRIEHQAFAEVAANWKKLVRIDVSACKGSAVTCKSASSEVGKLGANLALFIVDDPDLETSILYAPETKWCILNVRPIFADNPDVKTAKKRAMQETSRAFALLAGAMNSSYPASLMSAVSSPCELDLNSEPWRVPVDVIERFRAVLTAHGIAPYVSAPYRKACMEGWAPSPTNDAQRAIWNQVHAIPDKPIKIEYNEKRDKGK